MTGLEAGRTDHVHVVYHGIDPVKVGKKEKVIMYAGRLIPEKGALELAKAAAKLLPHYPDWKIAFVGARLGGAQSTPYAKSVGDTLKPLGKQVVFLGHQPHAKVMKLFSKASIAVVPSIWNEPLGRTAIEALATGCRALVTSGHGGLAEIAGDAGVIVSPVTPDGLALALQGLVEDPEALRNVQQMCVTRAAIFVACGPASSGRITS